jgi:hypothetical protein
MAYKKGFNEYKIFDDYVIIYFKKRNGEIYESYIDKEDLQKLITLNWSWNLVLDKYTQTYYVKTSEYLGVINKKSKHKTHYLHRIIMDYNGNDIIDHINHNTLDNRKINLRIILKPNNEKNRKGKNINNTSGYRNVCWIKGFWKVQLQVDGKNYRFPENFTNVDEAGKFAEEKRKEIYGEFAGKS